MFAVMWFLVIALFVLWIIGLAVHWAASIAWLLFVIAVVLLIINLISYMFTGRRASPGSI
jgi:hypothetical protein